MTIEEILSDCCTLLASDSPYKLTLMYKINKLNFVLGKQYNVKVSYTQRKDKVKNRKYFY